MGSNGWKGGGAVCRPDRGPVRRAGLTLQLGPGPLPPARRGAEGNGTGLFK